MSLNCRSYSIVASDCECLLNLQDTAGFITSIHLDGAVVYPATNCAAFIIKSGDTEIFICDGNPALTVEIVEGLICNCQQIIGNSGIAEDVDGGYFDPEPGYTITSGSTVETHDLTISNVGSAPGVVLGQAFPMGMTANWTSYLDPVTNIFYKIDVATYDATGTEFLVSLSTTIDPPEALQALSWYDPQLRSDGITLVDQRPGVGDARLQQPGRGLNLNDTDQKVVCGNTIGNFGTADFSISIWCYRTASAGTDTLFAKGFNTSGDWSIYFLSNDILHFRASGATLDLVGGAQPLNTWLNIIVTREAGASTLYVNGVVIDTSVVVANAGTSSHQVSIGVEDDVTGTRYFPGRVFDPQLFDRALTTTEVAAIQLQFAEPHHVVPNFPTDAIAGWHLDDNSLTVAKDFTGNGNDGTIYNGTAGMLYEGNDIPYSYQNLYGFSQLQNKLSSSSDDSAWVEQAVTLTDGQTDANGNTTAMRLQNANLDNVIHRCYVTGSSIVNDQYVVLTYKGVADLIAFKFTGGGDFTYNVATDSVQLETNTSLISSSTDSGWTKLVVQVFSVGSTTIQLAIDGAFGAFVPVNTTNYLDLQIQFTEDPNNYNYVPTIGTVIESELSPELNGLDLEGNSVLYSGLSPRDGELHSSPCTTWDGVGYLAAAHLVGSETVTNSGGTSTPSISAGRIDFTAGTCWDLELSDGTLYTCTEGNFLELVDSSGSGNNGTATTITEAALWATTQDVYHNSIIEGFNQEAEFDRGQARVNTVSPPSGGTMYFDVTLVTTGNIEMFWGCQDGNFIKFQGFYSTASQEFKVYVGSNVERFSVPMEFGKRYVGSMSWTAGGDLTLVMNGVTSTTTWAGTLPAFDVGFGGNNNGTEYLTTASIHNLEMRDASGTIIATSRDLAVDRTLVKQPIDLWLVAGQSNAVGRGATNSTETPTAGTAFEVSALNYDMVHLQDPLQLADPTDGSAWPKFCKEYYSQSSRKVAVVTSGRGSTSQVAAADIGSGNWDTTGIYYNRSVGFARTAIDRLQTIGYEVHFKGVLWIQGETDAVGINGAAITKQDYKDAFEIMLANYRAEFGDITMVMCRIGTDTVASDAGFLTIRDAQDELAASIPSVIMGYTNTVNFPGEGKMSDTVHYSTAGYEDVGEALGIVGAAVTGGQIYEGRPSNPEDIGHNGAKTLINFELEPDAPWTRVLGTALETSYEFGDGRTPDNYVTQTEKLESNFYTDLP